MKALAIQGPKQIAYEDVPDPSIVASTDAILQVEKTATCGSDLPLYHGPERPDIPPLPFYTQAQSIFDQETEARVFP